MEVCCVLEGLFAQGHWQHWPAEKATRVCHAVMSSALCMLRILLAMTMAMARSRAVAVAVARAVAAMGHRGSCIRSSPIARLATWRVRRRSNYRPKLRRSRGTPVPYANSRPCMLRILLTVAMAARSRQSLATL